ncbi:TPA: restriction endonuclease subunit S [Proteus mirabilis]|nr:restriction endonuclease subunit S [Proteus mirabilis]
MVPNGWFTYKFSEIVKETQLGTTERHKGEFCSDPIPLLKMGNLSWGGFNLKSLETLPRSRVDESLILKKGDFLFNTRNTPELVGKSAVWNGELTEAIFDNNINRIVFHNSIDPFYLGLYLNNGRGKSVINSLPAGSTSVAAIYWKDLKNIKLTLPPLPEQKKIAQILSTWDKAIATTEKLIDASQQQKKALMQQLLTGKKRLGQKDSSISYKKTKYGKIPSDWDYPAIKEISKQITKKNTESQDLPVLSCSKHDGFVDSLKYFKKKVYSDDTSGYRIIPRHCFGFPSNHIEEGSIGLQDIYEQGIVSPIYVVFSCDKKRVNNLFLYAMLKTEHYRQIFCAATNASVDRRGSLRWKEFSGIHVPLPSLEEQQKIASVLTAADKEIELLQAKLAHLKDEKKALMQQLLTGKRRVKVEAMEMA